MRKNLSLLLIITLLSTTYSFATLVKSNYKAVLIPADSVDLNDYVGTFKLAEGSPVESVSFSIVEGKLVAKAGDYPDAILKVKIKDVFEDPGMGGIFSFSRINNKVMKLKIEVQGFELFGELEMKNGE
jgi:hypothetical protein